MLTRRYIYVHDDELRLLCDIGAEETIYHLFFTCPFVVYCWNILGFIWDNNLSLADRILQARQVHNLPFFIEAFLIAAWDIWKLRNDRVFDRREPNHARWLSNFRNRCSLQSVRFKADLQSAFFFWLDAFS